LERLTEVRRANFVRPLEIGDRPRDPEHTVVASSR